MNEIKTAISNLDQAIECWLLEPDKSYLFTLHAREHLRRYLRAEPEARALTVEELRGINADFENRCWVWINNFLKSELSAYYRSQADYTHGKAFCCGYPGICYHYQYDDYGKTWLAYDRQPEEGVRG